MKIRSLKQQLNYCITQNCRIGESKRAHRLDPSFTEKGQVYSVQTAENLRAAVQSFTGWMKENHPEIRLAVQLEPEHVQEWIDANVKNWSYQTLYNRVSQMRTVFIQVNNTYNGSLPPLEIKLPEKEQAHKIRGRTLDKDDFYYLRIDMADRSTQARHALEIAYRCGLRAKEIARLHSDRINIDKWVLEVREGAKNGKHRDVPIRPSDRVYFARLKAETAGGYVCKGVGEDSLNRAIRRSMKELGLDGKYPRTNIHAIRKLYATERLQEEMQKGLDERAAWSIVQKELGHGERFRQELFDTYIRN